MPSSDEGPPVISALWRRIFESPVTPRVAVTLACFLLIFAITANHLAHPKSPIPLVGDVAGKDYKATNSIIYTDTEATKIARDASAREVGPEYKIDVIANNRVIVNLKEFFSRIDELAVEIKLIEELASPTEETEGTEPTSPEGPEINEEATIPINLDDVRDSAATELLDLLDNYLYNSHLLQNKLTGEDLINLINLDSITRENVHSIIESSLRDHMRYFIFAVDDELRNELSALNETIIRKAEESGFSPENSLLAAQTGKYFLRPNAVLDDEATALARDQAREDTEPIRKEVRNGEIYLRTGEVITQEHIDIMMELGMVGGARPQNIWITILLFTLILALALVMGSIYTVGRGIRQFNDPRYYLLFYTIITIAYLSSFFLIQRLTSADGARPAELLLSLASLPVIAAAVLISHYFTRILALLVSGFLAVIVTLAAGEPSLLLPTLFTSLLACIMIERDCQKSLMIRAIIILPLAWVTALIAQAYSAGIPLAILGENPWFLLLGTAPAPVALVLANFVLDAAFNIPTSSRLAEFDNQDHPLLRKLQFEAPGTWHHSMMVGLIAEAACQAIGGNTHLVRVACMYHDIGKLRRPEFFIENQHGGVNVHDKYSPWLSKIIIESHVKDGIAMAKAHGLPQELIDMIPEHHGTSLISYFFRKALAMSEDGFINEYDYRYPGPKPQTPEAACINLADAAESATRSLEEPTPHRIESLVNKIYEERLLDGQFDECRLDLNELETIKDTIIDRLIGSYHARIDYPEEEELKRQLQLKRAEGDKKALPDNHQDDEE